jgi:hypothetical protein
MKLNSLLLGALFASAAFLGQSASAADITRTAALVTDSDGVGGFNASFGDTFAASTVGSNFSDLFTFTVGSGFDSAGSVTSSYLQSTKIKDLQITGFSLVQYDPVTLTIGTSIAGIDETGSGAHPTDSWSLSAFGLSSGTYAIKVDGKVLGNGGGAFGGDLTIAAVPEPETYGMLLAGLGLVGFMARRRKA